MRNHPSVFYIRNARINDGGYFLSQETRTITLAMKVVVDDRGHQHLAAALAMTHPDEKFITEEATTDNGLDSYVAPLERPKGKFPFVKSEGRALALSRLNEAISKLPEGNVRGKGFVCISNDNPLLNNIPTYRLMRDMIFNSEFDAHIPFLNMSKASVAHIAMGLFSEEDDVVFANKFHILFEPISLKLAFPRELKKL